MEKIQCEVCGSVDVVKKNDGMFECQSCGVKYSLDEVKKLLVEITGKVQYDNTEKLNKLYQLARIELKEPIYENAKKYYDEILTIDPTSWEAQFYSPYTNAYCNRFSKNSVASLILCFNAVLNLINDNCGTESEKTQAIDLIYHKCIDITEDALSYAKKNYDKYTYGSNACIINILMRALACEIEKVFTENNDITKNYAVNAWKYNAEKIKELINISDDKEIYESLATAINDSVSDVRKYDANYTLNYPAFRDGESNETVDNNEDDDEDGEDEDYDDEDDENNNQEWNNKTDDENINNDQRNSHKLTRIQKNWIIATVVLFIVLIIVIILYHL